MATYRTRNAARTVQVGREAPAPVVQCQTASLVKDETRVRFATGAPDRRFSLRGRAHGLYPCGVASSAATGSSFGQKGWVASGSPVSVPKEDRCRTDQALALLAGRFPTTCSPVAHRLDKAAIRGSIPRSWTNFIAVRMGIQLGLISPTQSVRLRPPLPISGV